MYPKTIRLLSFILAFTFFTSAWGKTPEWSCPIEVQPGKRLGPVAIDITRSQVEQLARQRKLELKWESADRAMLGDTYRVYFARDSIKVNQIEIDLRKAPEGCLRVDGKKIPIREKPEGIAKALGDCGKTRVLVGGNLILCRASGVALDWRGWDGHPPGCNLRVTVPGLLDK